MNEWIESDETRKKKCKWNNKKVLKKFNCNNTRKRIIISCVIICISIIIRGSVWIPSSNNPIYFFLYPKQPFHYSWYTLFLSLHISWILFYPSRRMIICFLIWKSIRKEKTVPFFRFSKKMKKRERILFSIIIKNEIWVEMMRIHMREEDQVVWLFLSQDTSFAAHGSSWNLFDPDVPSHDDQSLNSNSSLPFSACISLTIVFLVGTRETW